MAHFSSWAGWEEGQETRAVRMGYLQYVSVFSKAERGREALAGVSPFGWFCRTSFSFTIRVCSKTHSHQVSACTWPWEVGRDSPAGQRTPSLAPIAFARRCSTAEHRFVSASHGGSVSSSVKTANSFWSGVLAQDFFHPAPPSPAAGTPPALGAELNAQKMPGDHLAGQGQELQAPLSQRISPPSQG